MRRGAGLCESWPETTAHHHKWGNGCATYRGRFGAAPPHLKILGIPSKRMERQPAGGGCPGFRRCMRSPDRSVNAAAGTTMFSFFLYGQAAALFERGGGR